MPTDEAKCLYAPSQTDADRPDDEAAQRSNHEQKTEGVTDEPWYADHYSGDQDEQAVEQLSGGHLSSLRLFPDLGEHAKSYAPDDEWPE